MQKVKYSLLIILFISLVPVKLYSQENIKEENFPIRLEGKYMVEIAGNMAGGIKSGSNVIGLGDIKLHLQTKDISFWENGEILINILGTHGKSPSENLVGDFQGVSNITSESDIYLYELWYKHSLGNVAITVGLQDMGLDFVGSENGALYMNGSFGIHSTISSNVSSPIFPLTALGAKINWNITDDISIKTAIFDGLAEGFDKNPYNLKWSINKDDGFFSISEVEFSNFLLGNLSNNLKIGYYYQNHFQDDDGEQVEYFSKYGFFLVADQTISDNADGNKTSFFIQTGFCPSKNNDNNLYLGAGFNFYDLFDFQNSDVLGIAIAHANFDKLKKSETAIELTYLVYFTKNIYVQPDLQYIINPMGTSEKLNNAFVGSLRVGIDF